MAHESGKNGGVYGNSLLVHNCDVAWDDTSDATCTPTTDTAKVGAFCARGDVVAAGADIMLMAKTIGALDLSTYEALIWWAKTDLVTALGNLHLLIDETANCTTPEEELDWPVMASGVWKKCFGLFTGLAATRDVIVGVGLDQVIDLADGYFNVDEVRAVHEIDGIKSWSLEYTVAALDVTDFANVGVSAFIPGISEWHGSFEGLKDGVPITIGTEVDLVLGETSVGTQVWIGKAIITNCRPVTDHDGLVSYAYDFQGTGALQIPTT